MDFTNDGISIDTSDVNLWKADSPLDEREEGCLNTTDCSYVPWEKEYSPMDVTADGMLDVTADGMFHSW